MTEPTRSGRPFPSRRRPALYRTILGIAVAALVAAWLPFSILYVGAVTRHQALVAGATPSTQTAPAGRTLPAVTTRASSASSVQSATPGPGGSAQAPAPAPAAITTHAS